MKDKLERTPFDETAFHDKVHEHYLGYQGELQKNTDEKLELSIQVNYFHSCLDDAMEFLLKTDQARGLKPHQIIRILYEKGILEESDAINANKINKIRNLFAHDYESPHMMRNAAEIINKIKIETPVVDVIPSLATASNVEFLKEQISKWNMHQRLDFIIHGLVSNMENKILFMTY